MISKQAAGEAVDKLQILYDGHVVNDLRLVVIRLYNTGNKPIEKSQYETPIEFQMGTYSNILNKSVLETKPTGIAVSLESNENKLVLAPLLLNPKDSITVKVLLDKISGPITVNARIAGVSEIRRYDPLDLDNSSWRRIDFLIPVVAVLVAVPFTAVISRLILFFTEYFFR